MEQHPVADLDGPYVVADAADLAPLNGTAGFPTSTGTWVRLAWHLPGHAKATTITGLQDALALNGVPRPIWRASASWHDDARQVVWQADEMTRAPDPVVSATATATLDPGMRPMGMPTSAATTRAEENAAVMAGWTSRCRR
ncbi:hypothetical protein [Thermomonospora umbrina]|uniref:Uncharacterized protein n=1 Tax=Thermomonospora umbrina TaxID=111806 RepID=A0A3D9SM83_9ACTN|nr:hypothetical protein DFJ69_0406 [Thermomonospora umbrina]